MWMLWAGHGRRRWRQSRFSLRRMGHPSRLATLAPQDDALFLSVGASPEAPAEGGPRRATGRLAKKSRSGEERLKFREETPRKGCDMVSSHSRYRVAAICSQPRFWARDLLQKKADIFQKVARILGVNGPIFVQRSWTARIHQSGWIHFSVAAMQKKILARRLRKGRNA